MNFANDIRWPNVDLGLKIILGPKFKKNGPIFSFSAGKRLSPPPGGQTSGLHNSTKKSAYWDLLDQLLSLMFLKSSGLNFPYPFPD